MMLVSSGIFSAQQRSDALSRYPSELQRMGEMSTFESGPIMQQRNSFSVSVPHVSENEGVNYRTHTEVNREEKVNYFNTFHCTVTVI